MGAQGFQGLLDGVSRETLQEDGVFFASLREMEVYKWGYNRQFFSHPKCDVLDMQRLKRY